MLNSFQHLGQTLKQVQGDDLREQHGETEQAI